jgi:epoxyqueuosine reductase
VRLFGAIAAAAAAEYLAIFGGFHPDPGEGLGATLLMLGPAEPGFWPHVTAEPEFADGAPDPLDRWSARILGALASRFGGTAHFPFGGPPYRPFYAWALRTGRAWPSPVTLLVHDTAGLFVSYRGALALPDRLDLPDPPPQPCGACAKPCLTACPAAALTGDGYDLAACHAFLDTGPGAVCMSQGCQVRCACPVSQSYARLPAQSAYHMRLFHR